MSTPRPKAVLFYDGNDDIPRTAPPHFPAHKARVDEFHARGDLLLVGTAAILEWNETLG
jgi:hypothetical protein